MYTAKAVQDAAQGGMVLASTTTVAQLDSQRLAECMVVGHMGRHGLKVAGAAAGAGAGPQDMDLYQLVPRSLVHRWVRHGCVLKM